VKNRISLVAALVLLQVVSSTLIAHALESESRVIPVTGSPITIVAYEAEYSRGDKYSREGVQHSLEYQNDSGQLVVAVQFGLVAFDIWNQFLDRTGGVSMESLSPQEKRKGTWVSSAYADFSFHTGVAYVSKVRFESGEIWSADLDAVVQELRKIQSDFDAAKLKKTETPKQ
jgi:hypothetical protein